jgi:hypothetical protein
VGASPEEIADFYAEHLAGRSCVIHWRLATSGPKDAEHAHPFPLSDVPGAPVLFHNGVFSALGTKEESDTAEMVRTLVRPITRAGADVRALDTLGPIWRRLVDGSAVVPHPDRSRWGEGRRMRRVVQHIRGLPTPVYPQWPGRTGTAPENPRVST